MRGFGTPFPAYPDDRAEILDEGDLYEAFADLDSRFYALEEAVDADARLNAYLNSSDS